MEEHLKEVCLCNNNLHFSHLLPMISAYEISKEHIEEFKDVLHHLIKEAKKTKKPQIINYGGDCDLLITDCRIHLIQTLRTFELPKLD